MKNRVRDLAGSAGGKVHVATFHGFGLWFLREEHRGAALPMWFLVCDPGDQVTLLKRCIRDVQVDLRRFDVWHLLATIYRRKMARFDRAHAAAGPGGDRDDYEAIAEELLPRYEQALRAQRSLDFDDLLVRPAALLEGDAVLRGAYRERFLHVLVDAYQDANRVQLRLLELLCAAEPGARAWCRTRKHAEVDAPAAGQSRTGRAGEAFARSAMTTRPSTDGEVPRCATFSGSKSTFPERRSSGWSRTTGPPDESSTARTALSRDLRSGAPSDSGRTLGPATRCGSSISRAKRRRRNSSQGRSGGDWLKAARRPIFRFCIG